MMLEVARELERRTKTFGIAVLKLLVRLPKSPELACIRYQLAKASADESVFWLEVITEGEFLRDAMRKEAERLLQEARELRAISSSSVATARRASQR